MKETKCILDEAARQPTKQLRKEMLDDNGLCEENFIFDGEGGYEDFFALSPRYFNNFDYHKGLGQDLMHTSFSSGPVPLEGGMSLFTFISLRGWFSLEDLNEAINIDYRWKLGHRVPTIGKYILEGTGQGAKRRPSPTGIALHT